MTEEIEDYIADAIEQMWGERCPGFHPDCHVCRAWKQYDDLVASLETMTGIAETFGLFACFDARAPMNGPAILNEAREARAILARQQQAAEEAA